MNLKLGFFDIDGTLIRRIRTESKSLKTRSINFALETVFGVRGIDYMAILGKRIYGMTDVTIMKSALLESGVTEHEFYRNLDRLFNSVDRYFEDNHNDDSKREYRRLPAIAEFLERLKKEDIRLGLVTGNIRKHSEWKMKNVGFDRYFVTGAFGDDAESRSDIMAVAIERNKDIPKESICHFGDSPPDLRAARSCGIRAVAVADTGGGTHSREELEKENYGLVINGWDDLEAIEKYLS